MKLDYHEYPVKEMIDRSSEFRKEMMRRRTVRDFDARPIPDAVIENALRTAASAPSGANRQPWRFVVIKDMETKKRIRVGAEEEEHEFYAGRAPDEW